MKLLTILLGHGRRVWTKVAVSSTDLQAEILSGKINPQNQWECDLIQRRDGESPESMRRRMIHDGYAPVIDDIFVPDGLAEHATALAVDLVHFSEKKTAPPSPGIVDLFDAFALRPDRVVAMRTLREHFNVDTTSLFKALESREQSRLQTIWTDSLSGALSW